MRLLLPYTDEEVRLYPRGVCGSLKTLGDDRESSRFSATVDFLGAAPGMMAVPRETLLESQMPRSTMVLPKPRLCPSSQQAHAGASRVPGNGVWITLGALLPGGPGKTRSRGSQGRLPGRGGASSGEPALASREGSCSPGEGTFWKVAQSDIFLGDTGRQVLQGVYVGGQMGLKRG